MKKQQVKKYNNIALANHWKRVSDWHADKFTNNIIPQIAFVGFRLPNGEMRSNGWVVCGENQAYFFYSEKIADKYLKNYNEQN